MLLLHDVTLPCLTAMIAGEPIKGSWWGHPKGSAIFRVADEIDDHPDVVSTKLLSRKLTFVHRRLWPALITVGRSREAWQMDGLSKEALSLLNRVDEEGEVLSSGKPAKQLEQKLLVASQQVHTESGAHAVKLMTWERFSQQATVPLPTVSSEIARAELITGINEMTAVFGGKATLPWQ